MSTDENNLIFFFNLAIKNHRENKLKDAEKFYNKALEVNSTHFDSNFYLGSLYAQLKNFIKSKELLKKAIKIQPKHALSHSNLGAVLKEMGNFEEAAEACKSAVKIEPNNVVALGNLGAILKEIGNFEEAAKACKSAIKIEPNNVVALTNFALVLIELGKIIEAINCYKKLNNIKSNSLKYYKKLGELNIVLGKKKEAIKFYKLAIKHESDDFSNYWHLSSLDNTILNENLKNYVNKTIVENKNNKNHAFANFLLSKYEFNTKNYEAEFSYLLKGHSSFLATEKKKYRNDVEYWLDILPNSSELRDLKVEIKKKNYQYLKPIFIVGVPRCGSTLVEKIIASGPQKVITGEEIGVLSIFVKKKVIKKESMFIDDVILKTEIIEKYKQKKIIEDNNKCVFTDKTLDNFFYIELIKELFPNAKIINCKRSPLSSIMSILKNNLPAIPWAHNIKNIFKYFDIYNKKIQYFEKAHPGFIYSMDYEKLVTEPENESKKLMEFCNLSWDPKCLEFYKREDLISKTASNIQVKKAIYKDSQKKYLPYEFFLNTHGVKYSWYN